MFTKKEQPWVDYLEIDEQTLESTLSADAPEEIRIQYQEYIKKREEAKKNNTLIPK